MSFFQRHPRLHNAVHWCSAVVAFLLAAPQEEIAQLTAFLPGSVTSHRYAGFFLGLLAFSRVLAKKAKFVEPGAPLVPASEAVTKVEKINPEKSR